MPFSSIEDVLADFKEGKMIVLVDDPSRENEGDLTLAAQSVTPEAINFMAKHGRGLICLAMASEIADRLNLPPMVERNDSRFGTAFTVSIDAKFGTTTGISAFDRARTIRTAISDTTKPSDLVRPGHVFPLRARHGGVLVRTGQTEGSVDLARLAGLVPAAVICEVMNDDGTMARVPDLEKLCQRFNLKMASVSDLIEYRRRRERLIEKIASVQLPTRYGDFRLHLYKSKIDEYLHIALCAGGIGEDVGGSTRTHEEPVLVRVHSECLTGDIFESLRCDCGDQLHKSLKIIAKEGKGVLLYMRQEGRGIGLVDKLRAYELQEKGLDTVAANKELGLPPDLRNYGIGAQILVDLGVRKLRLLTNNPRKIVGLEGYGLQIVERLPIQTEVREENLGYLQTKSQKMGHLLNLDE